jgi:hypothetical protein
MYVLMQIYPLEANADDGSDDNCCLDVLAVGSEAELEHYLAAYRFRYRAACQALAAWDNMSEDWGPQHDSTHVELLRRYQVYGSLISGTKFKIVQCLSSGRPSRDEELEPVVPPASHA